MGLVGILTERRVQDPVAAVFKVPVAFCRVLDEVRVLFSTGYVVASFPVPFLPGGGAPAFGLHHARAGGGRPLRHEFRVEYIEVGGDPAVRFFSLAYFRVGGEGCF